MKFESGSGFTWRPPGSPLLYDDYCLHSVYGSGDPGGRHVAHCDRQGQHGDRHVAPGEGAEDMRKTPRLLTHWLVMLSLLALVLSACSQDNNLPASSPTPVPSATNGYSLAGGGPCVQLGQHPQASFANVRVSHDSYLAHSEPMLVENPRNPLNLVGGTKFFTDPKHYQFQIGYFASF